LTDERLQIFDGSHIAFESLGQILNGLPGGSLVDNIPIRIKAIVSHDNVRHRRPRCIRFCKFLQDLSFFGSKFFAMIVAMQALPSFEKFGGAVMNEGLAIVDIDQLCPFRLQSLVASFRSGGCRWPGCKQESDQDSK
jgi:hypothetical protein